MDDQPQDTMTRDLLVLGAVFLALMLPSLFTRQLWDPDETRYLEVAREMIVRGDYLVPHLNGEVYPAKPPMFFWLALVFVFFSAVSGKRAGYLMPLAPGIIQQRYANDLPTIHLAQQIARSPLTLAVMAVMAAVVVLSVAGMRARQPQLPNGKFIGWVVGFMVAIAVAADFTLMPVANRLNSSREFGVALRPYVRQAETVYLSPQSYDGAFNLHTGILHMPELQTQAELQQVLESSQPALVIAWTKSFQRVTATSSMGAEVLLDRIVRHKPMLLVANAAYVAKHAARADLGS